MNKKWRSFIIHLDVLIHLNAIIAAFLVLGVGLEHPDKMGYAVVSSLCWLGIAYMGLPVKNLHGGEDRWHVDEETDERSDDEA